MAALRDLVNEALKTAMKSRDAARTSALRMMLAAFKNRDVEVRGGGGEAASEDELLASLAKMIRSARNWRRRSTMARGPSLRPRSGRRSK